MLYAQEALEFLCGSGCGGPMQALRPVPRRVVILSGLNASLTCVAL